MSNSNKLIVIAGPTAVGKTRVAIKLAQHFQTDIISADSRQCYQELNIGVAKPSSEELAIVKHYFINSHSIRETVNAAIFEGYALQATNEIFQAHQTAVMVGGTGLYIKAFCEGIDDIPDVPVEIHKQVINDFDNKGLEWLQDEIKQKDPEFWEVTDQKNPKRLMRALEVRIALGKSILSFRKQDQAARSFEIIKIGLELPKEQLHNNIHLRIDQMIEQGLIEEARSLIHFRNLNALQTVGYREFFDYFDGNCSMEKAIEQLRTNTRRYAKRQMTWFKKDASIKWFSPDDFNGILEYINSYS